MPGRRAILPSAMFTLVLIAALSSQATRTTHAADECLAKPNGPTPQGQHWYYRIDHANNNRQCWRLAPEGLPVQKTTPQSEEATASEPDPPQQPRSPKAVIAAPARAPADTVPATAANPIATLSPSPWPETSKLPTPQAPLPTLTPALLPMQSRAAPQTASADDTVPVVVSDDTPAATGDSSPTRSVRAQRSQRPATEGPQPAATPQQFAGIDHTFALLMVMFGLLAVTGPILHFTHRQRQREVINYKPPRWAPVIPLNTPAPRVRVTPAPDPAIAYRPARRAAPQVDQTDWQPAPNPNPNPSPRPSPDPRPDQSPAPIPARPPDANERLRHALQQLVDRIQTIQPEPRVARRPVQRADIEMMKSAR